MGQRSQIFVRYNKEEGKKHIIARYYQWNFAERMISRARYGMGWIHQMVKDIEFRFLEFRKIFTYKKT